ncbi:cytochrome P450 [Microbacterium protaetiae]|uniref:Cytochrome P450 n=1 Tax=Microbacterium protaetiae TaxID=2509458 RepID=A0A4P6ECY7_9MICO|nr:cytochrome P450 [Microbacterium protaetiae]QAY59526.1 cytochrome P450 [Microbacterium protaetiae]
MTDLLTAPTDYRGLHTAHAFDAMSDDYYRDPARHVAAVRDEHPVFWYPWLNAWIVTKREDILKVLGDWTEFSSSGNTATIEVPESYQKIVPPGLMAQLIVGMDPEDHTVHRNIALRGFTKARMESLRPQIEERAHRIIDKIEHQGSANIMAEYCIELTTQTILAHLGLGYEYDELMRRLRRDMGRVLSSAQEEMPQEMVDEVWDRFSSAFAEMSQVVAARRANPGTDFISEMAVQRDADGQYVLSVAQVAIKVCEFAMAGTDSTAQAMTNAILFLSAKPQYIDEAIEDPTLWANVFEETIRRRPSSPFASRKAMHDLELSGVQIKKGDMVWVSLASANTDPAHHADAWDFDIHRENPRDHLAFTQGRHTCLGQELARVQGATGLKVLFERLPSLRPAPDFPLEFIKMALLPVRTNLPVTWDVDDIEKSKKNVKREMNLTLVGKDAAADGVVALQLAHPDGDSLPEWQPGAHVDLAVPVDGGVVIRQYSLSSSPADRGRWRLGVLRETNGRGGSEAVHDRLQEGDSVRVGWPRNNFRFTPSPRYVFVAGGIGITPILPMIEHAEASGAEWELHYGGRSRSSMAFMEELARYGDRVHLVPGDEMGHPDLEGIFSEVVAGTLVYACGPEPLLKALEAALEHWPEDTLHTERFAPKKIERSGDDEEFEVEFATSGRTVRVPVGVSILEVAEKEGITAISSCREGTCGTCEMRILAGQADHRDSILTSSEQQANESMMICVSRAAGSCPRLVLDA